jgi:hypothetical protein
MIKFINFLPFFFLLHTCFAQEDFFGQLPGWANLQSTFKAKGDGVTDDTKCIQAALNSFTQPLLQYNSKDSAFMVLYIPAGTYCISTTITLRGKIGVTIIGEDPANTIIKWIGAENDTMFWADGSAYFKLSRITWDANGTKNIEAIGLHWKNKWTDAKSQSSAPVNIEFSDNYFIGRCKYGISGGTVPGEGINQMDSEIAIKRCVFNSCTDAGIYIKGYNALDYWIWDCKFINCYDGINNNYGNYHVYRSYFKNSKLADMHNTNGYYTSARHCYSEGSYTFSHDEGASSNPFKRIFQSNIVIAPVNIPIELYHLGKISLIDNRLDSATKPAVKTFVQTGSWAKGNYQVLSVNNIYQDKNPITFTTATHTIFTQQDKYGTPIKKNGAAFFLQQMDKTPMLSNPKIIAIAPGSNSEKIQQYIAEAMKLKNEKVVLYFKTGTYILNQPLVIPANANFQIIGDGYLYASVLEKGNQFPKGQSLLQIQAPTNIVIRDIQLGKFTTEIPMVNGIGCNHLDRLGASVFIDQLYTNASNAILAENVDYLYIQEVNSFYSCGKRMTGGTLMQQGKGAAKMNCFGGQFAGATVDENACFVAKDCWWEGKTRKPLSFSGSGSVSIDGAMLAPINADSNVSVSIKKFKGKIALTNMYLQGGFSVDSSTNDLSLLLWNIHFYHALNPLQSITPSSPINAAFIGLTTQCFTPTDKRCAEINTVNDIIQNKTEKLPAFLETMLSDNRQAIPRQFKNRPPNASSIFIYRVSIGDCNAALHFTK